MADNELTVLIATGVQKTLRDRDIPGAGHAQKIDVAPWFPTPVASSQYALLVSSSVVTLTVPAGATHALITVDGADVRFTEDTASPTTGATGNGLMLKDGTIAELALPNALKFIRAGATDARLNVSYRKYV